MGSLIPRVIQPGSGAVGGIAGALIKNSSLGTAVWSIAKIIGGGLGGQLLAMLGVGAAAGGSAMDMSSIVRCLASAAEY